jgi:putative ABC transport system ATP-binding protein
LTSLPSDPVVELVDVTVAFGKTQILDGVSVSVRIGDYVTVTGKSGAGKSTLLNLIAGTIFPTAGTVRVAGCNLGRAGERVHAQRDAIGYLFQAAHLVGWMSAEENVALGMRYQKDSRVGRTERAREALELVGLAHRMSHRPSALSGGERQRVALARAIARRPRVLLADEPTGNLDAETGASVMELIERVSSHAALVLVTHDPLLANRGGRQWRVAGGKINEAVGPGRHDHVA